ncbi:YtxH domain-containing protein, partial [Staphylococcus hominis]
DRDAFETNNSGNDLHGRGANQLDQNNFVNTPHYNRDDYESYNHPKFSNQATRDTNQEIDYKTYYNDPRFKSRKRFIVSFITGAIIGSTIGLLTKNKANQKIDDLKAKEQEVKDNYYSIKQQTEETIDNVRHKIEDLKNRKHTGISSDELAAQRRAIQSETSNHLADESPLAKEIQEAKAETTVKENNYFNNEHNSAEEIVAQQNAIKDELSTNLADESPQAQEIQEAKKEAIAKDEKQEETDALAAQRRAIQSETSSNLADESPQAQEVQEAKKEAIAKDEKQKETDALAAQRRAIQSETSSNLADESPQAQEIQEAKKEAIAKDEKQEETDALAAQHRAIQNESAINQLSNPARSHQTQNSENESQASKIASAARTKQTKLKDNKDVASNTQKLFEEAPITSSKYDKVPNLITKNHKSFNKDEEITKNKQTHHDAKFEKGVITHQHQPSQSNSTQKNKNHNQKRKNQNRKNQNRKNQNKNKTPKQQQRAEKANSKIEKRTFND